FHQLSSNADQPVHPMSGRTRSAGPSACAEMAGFFPLRTGAIVVRQMPSWHRRALLVVGMLGSLEAIHLAYEWGSFEGGYSKFAEIQRRRELHARIEALQGENERLRAAVAAAELESKVENQAYAAVEKNLADLQA